MDAIVANRYASALYSLAIEENKLEEVRQSLSFAKHAIYSEPDFLKILRLPQVTKSDKHEMITKVFKETACKEVFNFLSILIDKNRIGYLSTIDDEFEKLYNEFNKVVKAVVYSAKTLDEVQIKQLTETLSKKFKSEVEITNKIDTTLISGIRVEANNQIIDNSIFTKLSNLRDSLLKVNI
jgi:F-type H+-transporting ATPase subunit delta